MNAPKQAADGFPLVYRYKDRPAIHGKRCRIVAYGGRSFWSNGTLVMNAGDNAVALEFEDGTKVEAIRSAVVHADSSEGRQTLFRIARGGKRFLRKRDGRPARASG